MIRAAFLGTPDAAVPILAALGTVAEVTVVITRPDKPRGRSGDLQPPPVKVEAERHGWPVAQPTRSADLAGLVGGSDVAVVAAYGRIVPGEALAVPVAGFVNVHFSLLPRWRGASPVVRAILAGDVETGVTLMQLDEGLDTGPTFDRVTTAIDGDETTGVLTMRLADLGAHLLASRLDAIVAGALRPIPQDPGGATAAAKVTVHEAHLDPRRHRTESVLRAVRAFNPKPGAWSVVDGDRMKVWEVQRASGEVTPGTAERRDGAVLLGTADGVVALVTVQPAGKPPMSATAWMNGRRGTPAIFE